MNKGAKILKLADYRSKTSTSIGAVASGAMPARKNIESNIKPRNPYTLIKLLKAQNWFARRAFTPRVNIRLSAYTPDGRSAVKIRL